MGTVLALFGLPTAADLACKASGYCSLGELSPFVGDLYPSARVTVSERTQCSALLGKLLHKDPDVVFGLFSAAGSGLHKALQSRSYKKEVIIMVSDLNRLDSFLQAADSLESLGLSNVLLLSHSEAMCAKISPKVPDVGCSWSSHKHPSDLGGNFYVWSLRYRILAR